MSYVNFRRSRYKKSCYLKIFKSQYLSEFLSYGLDFLHVIITFIGIKITICNMGSHSTPLLISGAVVT